MILLFFFFWRPFPFSPLWEASFDLKEKKIFWVAVDSKKDRFSPHTRARLKGTACGSGATPGLFLLVARNSVA